MGCVSLPFISQLLKSGSVFILFFKCSHWLFFVVHRLSTSCRAQVLECSLWQMASLGEGWVAPTWARTCVPWISRQILNHWTTKKVPQPAFYVKTFPYLFLPLLLSFKKFFLIIRDLWIIFYSVYYTPFHHVYAKINTALAILVIFKCTVQGPSEHSHCSATIATVHLQDPHLPQTLYPCSPPLSSWQLHHLFFLMLKLS